MNKNQPLKADTGKFTLTGGNALKKNRYPGIHSFTNAERGEFFGRERETKELYRLLLLNPVVVLFGKSGTGKTSLLQAGVAPLLHERLLEPLKLRLNDTAKPIRRQIWEQFNSGDYLPVGTPDNLSLAELCARFDSSLGGEALSPVLLLDQFEELFTLYPDHSEQRSDFIGQLAELIQRQDESAPRVRVVISIRSDFLYLLDRLSVRIPTIMRCRYELRALDEDNARRAITAPAALIGDYASQPFSFSLEALETALDGLSGQSDTGATGGREVEAFLLQQFCRRIEQRILGEQAKAGFSVTPDYFGGAQGISGMLDEFYAEVLAKFPDAFTRRRVQQLVEEKLISGERRIIGEHDTLCKELSLTQVDFQLLCAERLLHQEPRGGAFYYEISHDTLLGPIIKSRKARLEVEERATNVRRMQRLVRSVLLLLALSAGAVGAAVWALGQRDEAERQKAIAEKALMRAETLINAFYFYADRFALAYGAKGRDDANVFYFIDQNGDEVAKLGKWELAEQFNWLGFAKVKRKVGDSVEDCLLDTLGNVYPVAFDVNRLRRGITALDLSGKNITSIPELVFQYPELEILLLENDRLISLPPEIGTLVNLKVLNLKGTELSSLPPEIGNLTNLQVLNLGGTQLTTLPQEIRNLTNLTWLDLGSGQPTILPPEIGNLTNLKILNLWGNPTNLPPEIRNLTKLSVLNLHGYRLKSLPPDIWKLTNLTKLGLIGVQLSSLPPEIGNLVNLTKLNLEDTRIAKLPSEIGNLINLTKLDLRDTRLTKLPSEIGNLVNLTQLNLRDNQLTILPPEIGKLTNLIELNLFNNRLITLPPEFGSLTNLGILNLQRNQLISLSSGMDKLANLSVLNLQQNQLASLPPGIGKLTNLTQLDLQKNQLNTLPTEIGNLTNLTEILLQDNPLVSLPPEIGKLANLTKLNLLNCRLTSLPQGIGKLTNLKELCLTGCQLSSLPVEIGKLTNLEILYLSNNQLIVLPPEIGSLTNLRELHLWRNRMTTLPPEIGNLTKLAWLGLLGNKLTAIPPEIGNLTNLVWLNLEDNQLAALPPQIGSLTKLAWLNLSKNQLTVLPPQIGSLTSMVSLNLNSNSIIAIPTEIEKLTKLGELNLRSNSISENELKAVKRLLSKCEVQF